MFQNIADMGFQEELEEENKIKNIVKSKNKTVQKFFFKDITIQFIFSSSNLDILKDIRQKQKICITP